MCYVLQQCAYTAHLFYRHSYPFRYESFALPPAVFLQQLRCSLFFLHRPPPPLCVCVSLSLVIAAMHTQLYKRQVYFLRPRRSLRIEIFGKLCGYLACLAQTQHKHKQFAEYLLTQARLMDFCKLTHNFMRRNGIHGHMLKYHSAAAHTV